MKILQANASPLTNFEVLNFLRSKVADKDQTRVLAEIVPSEYKKFDLAKVELLNILNLRPTQPVKIFSIIEDCTARMGDNEIQELVEMVADVLPPANLGTNKDKESDIAIGSIEEGINKDKDIAKETQFDEVFTDVAETER